MQKPAAAPPKSMRYNLVGMQPGTYYYARVGQLSLCMLFTGTHEILFEDVWSWLKQIETDMIWAKYSRLTTGFNKVASINEMGLSQWSPVSLPSPSVPPSGMGLVLEIHRIYIYVYICGNKMQFVDICQHNWIQYENDWEYVYEYVLNVLWYVYRYAYTYYMYMYVYIYTSQCVVNLYIYIYMYIRGS